MRMRKWKLPIAAFLNIALCYGCNSGGESPTVPSDSTGLQPIPLDGRGGGVLAYTHQPGPGSGIHEIYAINADGTGNTRIINASIGLNHHDWSPDAQQIAAVGYVSQATWSIHVFDADGGGLARFTNTNGVWDNEPTWSPDGAMIAFTRMYPAQDNRSEIWTMNADGSDQRWIGVEGFTARWSPDGTRFIYQSSFSEVADVHTCAIDGTDEQRLTSTAFDELTPIWSPDGSQVAFAANDDGDFDIYVMDSDGGNRRRLTDNDVADYVPRWSPDGSMIAFDSGLPGNDHWEVYVINVDGTNLRRVTNTLAPATAINPVWRPDPAQAGPLLLIRQGTSVTVDGDIPGDPV